MTGNTDRVSKSRRQFLRLAALGLGGAALAACGATPTPTPPPVPTKTPAPAAPTATSAAPAPTPVPPTATAAPKPTAVPTAKPAVTVTWMVFGSTGTQENAYVQASYKTYPGLQDRIKVETIGGGESAGGAQKIRLALAAGSGVPEIAQFNRPVVSEFAYAEELMILDDYFAPYRNDVYAGALELVKYKGTFVAFPFQLKSKIFYYRGDKFADAGIKVADIKTVIASVTSGHALPAVSLGRFAEQVGANGIMSMPPHMLHPDAAGCYEYYQALAEAVNVPIFLQNYGPPLGTPMAAELMARMCRELPNVRYIKEETFPEPRQIRAVIAAAGDSCKGVFGGQGGMYLLDEHRHGGAGTMPAGTAADILVTIWARLEAGDTKGARELFNRLLPLLSYERLYGVGVYKEVLYRRGVLATPLLRAPGQTLDAADRAVLDEIMAEIEPLFQV